jgi:hypothetical protein
MSCEIVLFNPAPIADHEEAAVQFRRFRESGAG